MLVKLLEISFVLIGRFCCSRSGLVRVTTEDEAASDQAEAFYGLCGKGGRAQRSGSVIGSILFLVPFVSDTLRCMSSHNSDRDLRNSG